MSEFIDVYAKVSKTSVDNVVLLMDIQNKQFTEYPRIKTCLELWNHQQQKIEKLETERDLQAIEINKLRDISNKLEEGLKIANEAISFYASEKHWLMDYLGEDRIYATIISEDWSLIEDTMGGKCARQAKAEIAKLME